MINEITRSEPHKIVEPPRPGTVIAAISLAALIASERAQPVHWSPEATITRIVEPRDAGDPLVQAQEAAYAGVRDILGSDAPDYNR